MSVGTGSTVASETPKNPAAGPHATCSVASSADVNAWSTYQPNNTCHKIASIGFQKGLDCWLVVMGFWQGSWRLVALELLMLASSDLRETCSVPCPQMRAAAGSILNMFVISEAAANASVLVQDKS